MNKTAVAVAIIRAQTCRTTMLTRHLDFLKNIRSIAKQSAIRLGIDQIESCPSLFGGETLGSELRSSILAYV
jgi:hypothetical protein